MNDIRKIAVTGAFGYTGSYIARRLLENNVHVMTLTNSPRKNTLSSQIETVPFNFDTPFKLAKSLEGTDVLVNTYWVRFNHKNFTHSEAVENTIKLFMAAKIAGVKRIVHTSITNPDENSHLEYFAGKGKLERILIESGMSYAILRPNVIFGKEDILINNIAWSVRHLPVFGVFGDGNYKLRPIFVEDYARLVAEKCFSDDNIVLDATGPEIYTYRELAKMIAKKIGKTTQIFNIPPWFGYLTGYVIGKIMGDIVITKPEIEGLMAGLLCTDSPPPSQTKLSEWIEQNKDTVGTVYANELKRRKKK